MIHNLISEELIKAKTRSQPYINLTNKILKLEEISSVENLKSFLDLQLGSLYFSAHNIKLDEKLANFVAKLRDAGIREILLFSNVANKQISIDDFNKFLEMYKIDINFRMLEIDEGDLSAIKSDIYGQKDILATDHIEDNKLFYKDGFSVPLLSNIRSDEIILQNYNFLRDIALDKNSFELKAPEYIQENEEGAKKRIKDLNLLDKKNFKLEVSHQIDFSAEISQEFSKEQEIDLDLEQADYKFTLQEAQEKASKLQFSMFFPQSMHKEFHPNVSFYELAKNIFVSDNRIKFVTKDALNLIVKNYFFFDNGIDTNNMPIGLALKDGIIFASNQRPSSMKINEFTVKLDDVTPFITNPLSYSWLKFASKSSISLNDIYGTEDAPEVFGYEQHPRIHTMVSIEDIMLDIPYNYRNSRYTEEGLEDNDFKAPKRIFEKINTEEIILDARFGQIMFPNLSAKDKARLDEIYVNLEQRGIEKIFPKIISSNYFLHGGFLFEEKTSLFLIKLFEEILPLADNNHKCKFFIDILSDVKFKKLSNLQDIFEALHGFYSNFSELLIRQEASDDYKTKAFDKVIEIIKTHIPKTTSLKSILGRFNNLLETNESRGGNLAEQLEYLAKIDAQEILINPEFYTKAKELGLSAIHEALALDKSTSKEFKEDLSPSNLINKIYDQDNGRYQDHGNAYYHDESLTTSLRYFSKLASHQRASIDNYAKYFYNLDHLNLHKSENCNPRSNNKGKNSAALQLKTVDYVEANILAYKFLITSPSIILYAGNNVDFKRILQDQDIAKNLIVISVTTTDVEVLIRNNNKITKVKFSEFDVSPGEINLAKSFLINNINPDGEIYKLIKKEIRFFSEINLDTLIETLEETIQSNEAFQLDNGLLYIAKTDDSYDLVRKGKFNDDEVIDKSSLSEKLDNQITEALSKGDKEIILLPNEIKGTIFEEYATSGYNYNVEDIIKQAERNFTKLTALLQSAPKENVKDFCNASVSVIAQNMNLVNNFTTIQAAENVKLLSLNIISSSGRYYDASYPDGEFDAYISLFNTLFSNVKIYEEQKIAITSPKPEEDYNYKTVSIGKYGKYIDYKEEIKQKEKEHKQIIGNFLLTFKENPEFNFGQIVALGLVRNLDLRLGLKTITNAKVLLPYGEYFGQMLRVILATPITSEEGLAELDLRTKSVANIINKLATIHNYVTRNGENPENLVFFAALFSREENLTNEKINDLLSKLDNLDKDLKSKLLNSFAKCKLPFDFGKITQNNFPILSFEDIDNKGLIEEIIAKAQEDFVSYEFATRFNDLGLSLRENALIDLSDFEQKYDAKISNELKNLSYKQLKEKILESKEFVQKELGIDHADSQKTIAISKNLLLIMLKTISKQDSDSVKFFGKIVDLLFDEKKQLELQFLNIEINIKTLDSLFKDKDLDYREKFIDLLQGEYAIPKEKFYQILTFFNNIKETDLVEKNLTLLDLVEKSGSEIIGKYFDSYVIATNAYLKGNISIDLSSLYSKIENLSKAKYSTFYIKQIIAYCVNNNDFDSIDIYTKLDGNNDNIGKIVEFLTKITPYQLQKINSDLGKSFKALLSLKAVLKIELIAEIALDYGDLIGKEQYSMLIAKAKSNDGDYIKLLHNFLVTKAALSKEAKIQIVFENLNSITAAQTIFSEENLKRFDYEEERVKNKIAEIKFLNEDKSLLESNQGQIFEYFQSIIEKAKEYRFIDSNALHDEAIKLKHDRSLAKDGDESAIINMDLKFLAISIEIMFRETGKFPRDTQIIVIINSMLHNQHIIEQIATGEGKSITTALHASYLWFTGQTVDVVTSSRELAVKDLLEFYNYYHKLGINNSQEIIMPNSEIAVYKKGGINYSTASDLALFRANREFSSDLFDKSLNTQVSLICDEVDFTLTSEINFKLAIPVVNTNQEESRVLLEYINDFIETSYFKNEVDEKDDVRNLKMFLTHQFKLYNPSYRYPLGELQKQELRESTSPIALRLYKLHKALEKSYKDDDLFNDLLDSSLYAKTLDENVHYILPKMDLENKEKLLKAIPIIKDQPSYGTNFGEGVQSFLHLIIEKKYPNYMNKLDISMSLSTIFNVSPKNFFDYYRLTNGKIIGLTGTAGDKNTIEEFKKTNKMVSFDFPRFKENLKVTNYTEAENESSQLQLMLEIIEKQNIDRPIIIFTQNAKEAEKIFFTLTNLSLRENIQLYSGSLKDTQPNEVEIRKIAGNFAKLTVTTPMLGRGTDFETNYPKGFLAINLCTDITETTLKQIEGRVARSGNEGEIVSIFNREIFGDDIQAFMSNKALKEHDMRKENQPLTDILQYFNKKNQDQKFNAIKTNKFITKAWKEILEHRGEKSLLDLKDNLIAIVKEKYPKITGELDNYLQALDEENLSNLHEHAHANFVSQNVSTDNELLYSAEHFEKEEYEPNFIRIGGSSIFNKIEKPSDNQKYQEFYNKIYKANAVTMLTHALTLEKEAIKFKDGEKIYYIEGEGSNDNLMLDEFKKSFNSYRKLVSSKEVDEISKIIDNFSDVKNVDITKLEYGKYQAINIVTKFDSTSSHAESLITDGKFLFWINRGADTSVGKPGIKLFKIIKNLDEVKELFGFLKIPQSQTETRSKIYDLLREDGDKNIPEYVQIEMKPQKIGNCGWTQTKGMLKAAVIVARLGGDMVDFPDVSSSHWQKILKDSDDIYKDFTAYDRIKRLEAVLYLKDKDFPLEFLDEGEQKEIDERREFLENPILPELLEELEKKLSETIGKYRNTIYEDKAFEILYKLKLEVAIESPAGEALIRAIGKEKSIALLSKYQKEQEGNFKTIQRIYKEISEGAIKDESHQDNIFKQTLEYLVES